jgi:asparagine synthase (glutamine-hydrolysing)
VSGLCGWFGGAPGAEPQAVIRRMADALPQYRRSLAIEASEARFGLAVRADAATSACVTEAGIAVAVEGYPEWSDPALAGIARESGHAKALIAAYRAKGIGLFEVVRGAFSLALLDQGARRALLAIDRLGVQTLCYAEPGPDLLVFGSTTDTVRAHPGVRATVALQSIFDYLYFGDRVPAPRTIYAELRKLAPGEYLLWEGGQCRVANYWYMPYRADARVDKAVAAA